MPSEPLTLDPETLDKLRRGFPLRMDRQGNFTFEADPLSHPGVVALFRRGLDANEAGEIELHVAEQWTYLNVDDLPLRALRVDVPREGESMPMLLLDDGRRVPLDPDTLWEEPEVGLRCTAPSQRSGRPLGVRLGNTAAMDLSKWMVWDDEFGRPQLEVDGRRWAIRERAPGTTTRV
ncbi:hypothetical protein ACNOYE_26695 [Nannocystaceae bacterium ST9]